MSEQAAENKLICVSLYPPSSLPSRLLLVFFPLRHSTSISVLHAPFSLFLPSSHRYATARYNIVLRPSFCPSLPFAPQKSELKSLLGVFFLELCSVLNFLLSIFVKKKLFLDHLSSVVTVATNQIPDNLKNKKP